MNDDDAATIQPEANWTDGLIVNRHGQPLGNLRNVLYALPSSVHFSPAELPHGVAFRVITSSANSS
jgi:hypothetical protein